jgi:acylpyruvate hydrolase
MLIRYELDGRVHVGSLDGDSIQPLGTSLRQVLSTTGPEVDADAVRLDDVRLLAPADEDARIFCVAQNYAGHAREIDGTGTPPSPVIFLKPHSSLIGLGQSIALPPVTSFLDYEAEMAIVVGGSGARLNPREAAALIAGVACFNDVTARDLQPIEIGGKEIIDWFSAKSLDGSSPMGPGIVLTDELEGDPDDLRLRCWHNDELVQDDRTSSMAVSSVELLSFISHRVALRAGDVIATGTPAGVGKGRGISLEDGDRIRMDLEGVGVLDNVVRAVVPDARLTAT